MQALQPCSDTNCECEKRFTSPVSSCKQHTLQAPHVKSIKTITCSQVENHLENKLHLISINFTPKNQPQLPKKNVLSYVFQAANPAFCWRLSCCRGSSPWWDLSCWFPHVCLTTPIHVLETNALVIKVGDFTIASPCSNPFVVYQLGSEFADCVLSTSKLSAEEPLHHPTCSKHVYQVSEPASEKKKMGHVYQVRDFLFHERCVSMYLEEKPIKFKVAKTTCLPKVDTLFPTQRCQRNTSPSSTLRLFPTDSLFKSPSQAKGATVSAGKIGFAVVTHFGTVLESHSML